MSSARGKRSYRSWRLSREQPCPPEKAPPSTGYRVGPRAGGRV